MSLLILVLNAGAAIFGIAFVAVYAKILMQARQIGPTPTTWILMAVGMALIAAYAVLELVVNVVQAPVITHTERVYFMLGNMIVSGVLLRVWHTMRGDSG